MTKEVAELLKQLQATGQYGILFTILALLAIVATAVWVVWLQRQTIAKLAHFSRENEIRIKEVESLIKAADAARTESRESQKIEQGLLKDQLDTVLKVNDGLRLDLIRVKQKQDSLRDTVKEGISVGLQEIREQLYEISVKEILTQVPHKFREDLEGELSTSAERIVIGIISKLKESPVEIVGESAVVAVAEKAARATMSQWHHRFEEWDRVLQELIRLRPEEWARRYGIPLRYGMDSEEALDAIAQRIAYHLRRYR
jgi:hypothetical protein